MTSRVCLLSGGLDSAAAAINAEATHGLFVDYGQEAKEQEWRAARSVARQLGLVLEAADVRGLVIEANGGPVYPMRNAILICLAAAMAVRVGAQDVVIGCAKADRDGFIDCRRQYVEDLSLLTMPWGVSVEAPLLDMSRDEIRKIAADIRGTWSCYKNGPAPCGRCASCLQ